MKHPVLPPHSPSSVPADCCGSEGGAGRHRSGRRARRPVVGTVLAVALAAIAFYAAATVTAPKAQAGSVHLVVLGHRDAVTDDAETATDTHGAIDERDGTSLAGEIDPSPDAAVIAAPAYAIGDFVWFDSGAKGLAGNGIQDAGELPVVELQVTLLTGDGQPAQDIVGTPVPVTFTDESGHYVFDNLAPGDYIVQFGGVPVGYEYTLQQVATGTPASDSDPAADGLTPVVVIGPGVEGNRAVVESDGDLIAVGINPTVDAGITPSAAYAVGDSVWIDNNGNGIQDGAPDVAVAGVALELFDVNGDPAVDAFADLVPSTVTDAAGRYVFDNLAPGEYFVAVTQIPVGYFLTGQFAGTDVALDSNMDLLGVSPLFTLGPGGENIRPVVVGDGDLVAVGIDPTIDAGLEPILALGDHVWFDTDRDGVQDEGEKPVADVTVTLFDDSGAFVGDTTTDADGYYVFDLLSPGSYRVSFSDLPDGCVFTGFGDGDDRAADSNASDAGLSDLRVLVGGAAGDIRAVVEADGVGDAIWIDPTVDAGIVLDSFAVGDRVWIDGNGNGAQDSGEIPVAGVTVSIVDGAGDSVSHSDGSEVESTVTDSDGHYVFDDLPPGEYRVLFSDLPEGFTLTRARAPGVADTGDSDADANGATEIFTIKVGEPQVRERESLDGDLVAFFIDSTRDAGLLPPVVIVTPTPQELPNTGTPARPELPGTGTPARPEMSNTGVNAGTALLAALVLLLLGGALTLITPRREGEDV